VPAQALSREIVRRRQAAAIGNHAGEGGAEAAEAALAAKEAECRRHAEAVVQVWHT
jgi:hypothetical protein